MNEGKKKVAYIRCSTPEQEPQLQLRDITTSFKLENGGFQVFEENKSAWKENVKRPEFDKLKSEIMKGKVSELFVWDVDRIFRNKNRLVEFFTLCKIYQTSIYSYRQKWLNEIQKMPPPFNQIVFDFMLSFLAWVAEDESNKKSERVKMAIVRKEGKPTVSYKGSKWGRKAFSPQTITRVLECHKQGLSLREIAKQVKVYDSNRNERYISKSAVHKIITANCVV